MKDRDIELRETIDRLREENRNLRAGLDATAAGRLMLRQGEEFTRLLAVSRSIVAELDLEKVYQLVADNAREIVQAERVLLPMLSEAKDRYTYVAASGSDADSIRGQGFASHVGMCGWVLRNQRSLLFGETTTHWMDETTTWEEGQESAVLVPIIGRKGIIGGLSALGKTGGGCFTQHDLDLLTMFANQVSTAIENALLFQEVNREVEERRRAERERERLIADLQKALGEIRTLHGILPICSSCKRIRDDEGAWVQLEKYIFEHSHAEFSHGLCQECMKKLYPEQWQKLYADGEKS